jgi:pimeloyl-ACP methyl ester carboxylesterase
MSGTHASWGDPFLEQLESDFDLVHYDHRGIGSSPELTGDFTIADLADDAAGLLDELGWDTAHVLGISMGGMVAQDLAIRHGDRIRTLTLGCTYCGGPGAALADPSVVQGLAAAMMSGDREMAFRAGYAVNVSPAHQADPSHYDAFRAMALAAPAPLPTILKQMQAISTFDVQAQLGGLDMPTLVIHGTADQMIPAASGELIAERIPGARLELLEDVGHMFWWEQPGRSAELLVGHALQRQP